MAVETDKARRAVVVKPDRPLHMPSAEFRKTPAYKAWNAHRVRVRAQEPGVKKAARIRYKERSKCPVHKAKVARNYKKWRSNPKVKARLSENNTEYYRAKRARPEFREQERRKTWKRKGVSGVIPARTPGCECCGVSALALTRALCLDHNHTNGKPRGWLCNACNLGIGKLGDNIEGLRKAVAYLERTDG